MTKLKGKLGAIMNCIGFKIKTDKTGGDTPVLILLTNFGISIELPFLKIKNNNPLSLSTPDAIAVAGSNQAQTRTGSIFEGSFGLSLRLHYTTNSSV